VALQVSSMSVDVRCTAARAAAADRCDKIRLRTFSRSSRQRSINIESRILSPVL
jgi:hypothetical protein